jgi:hypothetical protein
MANTINMSASPLTTLMILLVDNGEVAVRDFKYKSRRIS